VPSYELTKMPHSSLEKTANSIVPRWHVRSCIDFKCIPASPLDGERVTADAAVAILASRLRTESRCSAGGREMLRRTKYEEER
jgi:hypothetical protein